MKLAEIIPVDEELKIQGASFRCCLQKLACLHEWNWHLMMLPAMVISHGEVTRVVVQHYKQRWHIYFWNWGKKHLAIILEIPVILLPITPEWLREANVLQERNYSEIFTRKPFYAWKIVRLLNDRNSKACFKSLLVNRGVHIILLIGRILIHAHRGLHFG